MRCGRFGPLIGAALAMQEVYDLIAMVAGTEATVLITGDTGTGKELVAQTIQQLSPLSIAEVERRMILRTLEHFKGNKQQAAEVLKISVKTLYNRLNQYNGGA